MSEIWNNVLAIIASVGGAGIIIIGISSWLGNLWAHLLLNKQEAKFNKEIEVYKKELLLEIERYKTKAEQYTYISKIQFETEFTIYKELFRILHEFAVSSSDLYPTIDRIPRNEDDKKAMYKERYKDFCDGFNEYSRMINQYAPFIPKNLFEEFSELRNMANTIGCMFPELIIDDDGDPENRKIIRENHKLTREFNIAVNSLRDNVRDYLKTLIVQD